ncbi:MAG: hypothetical protein ACOYEV_17245 [Candidatus Nanopelagicales bacterium]
MPEAMTLLSSGWLEWVRILELLPTATALWLEPAEFKCGPLPPAQPLVHRIHAWDANGAAWRMVPGPAGMLLTALRPARPACPPGAQAWEVEVRRDPVSAWDTSFTGSAPAGLPKLERLEVSGTGAGELLSTISFLRAVPA